MKQRRFSLRTVAGLLAAQGALCAPTGFAHAQSSVTLYGAVSMDMAVVSNVYRNGVVSRTKGLEGGQWSPSRIGLKGIEDLGGGYSALFNLEGGFAPDTGATFTPFWNRNSTIGVAGPLGTLTMGRQLNVNDDVMWAYFLYGGYGVFRYSEFGGLSDFVNNSVKYWSPELGKFRFGAMYAFGEQTDSFKRGSTYELGGQYVDGPFSAGLTFKEQRRASEDSTDKLVAAGTSYRLGNVRGRLGYARSTSNAVGYLSTVALETGVDYFALQDRLRLTASYVMRNQRGTGDDSNYVRLMADYSLSKRTGLNVQFIKMTNKGAATERFFGDGAAGVGQSVILAGIRHNF